MPAMAERKQTRITATQRFKEMPCRECGELMRVGSNTRNAPRHIECGIRVAVEHSRQMRAKSGPSYEKWRNGMLAFAEREGRGRVDPE